MADPILISTSEDINTSDRLEKLKEKATRLRVSPEELVCASVEELLERPEDFQRTMDHVLKKNAKLYRRLA